MREEGRGKREGYTLIEVIVVLAILGLVLGISGLALASLKAPRESERTRALREARADAIRSGRPVRAVNVPLPTPAPLFLPDGRAIGPGVDPLTGAPVTRCGERGVALLEVLVALVILATAGTAMVELVGAGLRSERDARERERTLAAEQRVLAATTLLTREDFDRRLGQRRVGEFFVDVERPERALYRIAIAEARAPQVEDLVTVVYRREAPGAP